MKINEIGQISSSDWDQGAVDSEARSIKKTLTKKPNSKGDFGKHKLVPVTGLPEGFYLTYQTQKEGFGSFKREKFIVALIDARQSMDDPNVVSYLWFSPQTLYFGEPNYSSITGLKVRLLGTTSEYKGYGYAIQVYKMLVNHGQILFSDTSQTPDGTKLWTKLTTSNDFSAWGLEVDASGSTLELQNALGPIDPSNFDTAKKVVFSGYYNQFVLVPKNDTQTIELLKTKRPNWMK
jgi:hypothetical protein